MLRSIGGVIVGYLAMVIFVFVTFALAYQIMGADKSYQIGTYEVTGLWIAIGFVLSFIAALLGGCLCALVAKGGRAVMVLALFVLALGLVMAITGGDYGDKPLVREGEVGLMEAMSNSRSPGWMNWVNPLIGAIGVMIGGRRKTAP